MTQQALKKGAAVLEHAYQSQNYLHADCDYLELQPGDKEMVLLLARVSPLLELWSVLLSYYPVPGSRAIPFVLL